VKNIQIYFAFEITPEWNNLQKLGSLGQLSTTGLTEGTLFFPILDQLVVPMPNQ
jgi:hypothetical protein